MNHRVPFVSRLWGVAIAIVLVSVPLHAADKPMSGIEAKDALTDQARRLHLEGVSHFERGAYTKAYAAFSGAWGLKKHYEIAGVLGACELKLNKYRDAADHLHFFLENYPADGDATVRTKTHELFLQATAKIVQLTVTTSVPDAEVWANDEPIVAGRLGFYEPGELNLRASHSQYEPLSETRTMAAGSKETVALTFKLKMTAAPPPEIGPDWRLIGGVVAGVGAVAGFAVGVGGTVSAAGFADDVALLQIGDQFGCESPAVRCADLATAAADHDAALDAATGGYIVGSVLAVASVGLLVWWAADDDEVAEHEPEDDTVKDKWLLVPSLSPGYAGLTIGRTW